MPMSITPDLASAVAARDAALQAKADVLAAAAALGDLTRVRYFLGKRVLFARGDSGNLGGDVITDDGQHYARYAIKAGPGVSIARGEDGFYEIAAIAARTPLDASAHLFDLATVGDETQVMRVRKSDGTVTQATTVGNNVAPRLAADGSKVIYSTDRAGSWESYYQLESGARHGGSVEHPVMPRKTIMALGDSLTAAGYAATVAATVGSTLLVPSSSAAGGIGSQGSVQVAARYGASALTCSVAGDSLAAGANTLTAISVQLLSRVADGAGTVRTLRAWVNGVAGTLTSTQSTTFVAGALAYSGQWYTYTFTPDAGQTLPAAVPAGSPLEIDPENRQDSILLLWMGRNDVGTGAGWQTTVKAKIAEVFAAYKPLVRCIGLLSITNTTAEPSGSANYNEIVALNAELAALYPDSFIDVRSVYNAGTATDVPAPANTSDGTHYTDAGKVAIAGAVSDFMTAKGWF